MLTNGPNICLFIFINHFQAVHAASLKEGVCTLRVCEVILNLSELLMELGVLKSATKICEFATGEYQKPRNQKSKPKFPRAAPTSPMPGTSGATEQAPASEERPEDEHVSVAHTMLMNCVVR